MTEQTSGGPDEPTNRDEPTNAEPRTVEPTDEERHDTAAAESTGETEPAAAESTGETEPAAADPMDQFRTRHSVPSDGRPAGRWVAAVALVVALVALGVTAWVQYRAHWNAFVATSPTTSSTTSGAAAASDPQQVAAAKTKACDAYDLASKAVNVSKNTNPGSEPAATAVNARLTLAVAHTYLLERIDPATPPPLADAIRRYAANIQEFNMSLLAGLQTDDPVQAARIQEWGPLNDQITDLCK